MIQTKINKCYRVIITLLLSYILVDMLGHEWRNNEEVLQNTL